jgi:hypothetical protein
MEACILHLELEHNRRVVDGLMKLEDHFCDEGGWALYPAPRKDIVMVDLQGLDIGRYDAEGDAYVIELLNIVPADLIISYVED